MIFPSPTKNPQSSLNDKIRNKTKTELLELELLLHSNPGDCQHRGQQVMATAYAGSWLYFYTGANENSSNKACSEMVIDNH